MPCNVCRQLLENAGYRFEPISVLYYFAKLYNAYCSHALTRIRSKQGVLTWVRETLTGP